MKCPRLNPGTICISRVALHGLIKVGDTLVAESYSHGRGPTRVWLFKLKPDDRIFSLAVNQVVTPFDVARQVLTA